MTAPVRPESGSDRIARIRRNLARLKEQNAPREVVEQYLATERGSPEQELAAMPTTLGERVLQGLATMGQGATFGLADEVAGAVYGLLPGSRGYTQARDEVRASLKDFRQANPVTATALEAAGAVAVPVSIGARVPQLAGGGLARAAGRAAVDGAVTGAVSGAANAEGSLLDRAQAALMTGAAGGVIGGAAGAAIPAAGRAVSRTARTMGIGKEQAAARMLMDGTAITPGVVQSADDLARAQRQVDDFVAAGLGDEVAMVDVLGTPGARLLRGARAASPRADELITERLGGRNARASQRIGQAVQRQTGATGKGAATVRDELIEARAKSAGPLYEEARGAGDIFPQRTAALRAAEEAASAPAGPASLGRPRTRLPQSLRNLSDDDLQLELLTRRQAASEGSGLEYILDDPRIEDALAFSDLDFRNLQGKSRQKLLAERRAKVKALYGTEGEELRTLTDFAEDQIEAIRNAGFEVEDVKEALAARAKSWMREADEERLVAEMRRRGLVPGAESAPAPPAPPIPRTLDTSGDRIDMGLGDILESAPVQKFIREAQSLPQFKGMLDTDMRVLDYAYKQLGRQAESTADQSKKYLLDEIRRNMLRELTEANPKYGEAVQEFAGRSELIDAFNDGANFLGGRSDELKRAIAGLTPGEKAAAQRGAAEALLTRIRDIGSNADLGADVRARDVVQALFGKDGQATRFRQVFGEEAYQALLPTLRAEMALFNTSTVVRGGSNSIDKAFDAGAGLDALDLGKANPGAIVKTLQMLNRGVPDRGMERLADRMTAPGAAGVRSQLDDLLRQLQAAEAARLTGREGTQRVARVVGNAAGGMNR